MSAVDRLRGLGPNWDSYGAKPPSEAAIAAAESVERSLTFVPLSHGGFQVEIHAAGIELELEFGGEGEFESVFVERSRQ